MQSHAGVTIKSTHGHILRSPLIDQTYTILVALPESYQSKRTTAYPTLYLLDADFYFGLVTDLTRIMAFTGEWPETMVVGLAYPAGGSYHTAFRNAVLLRSRDLTPLSDPNAEQAVAKMIKGKRVVTGGAQSMLTFMRGQVIPFVERRYRSDPKRRVLMGHSFSGLFTLYALFSEHRLFKGYVAASPSLWYANEFLFNYEAEYAKNHKRLPVDLFLSVGGQEEEDSPKARMTSNLIRFAGQIRARHYEGLSVTSVTFPEYGHSGAAAPAFQAGLSAIFGR